MIIESWNLKVNYLDPFLKLQTYVCVATQMHGNNSSMCIVLFRNDPSLICTYNVYGVYISSLLLSPGMNKL